ncbi:MAG TPA: hypothetical protein VLV86_05155 [Vicinamibacterales bacterium]|nr:hypothetical protein [Vicinamibacterales bacterium]
MNTRIGRVLIVLAALAVPLRADLSGITTTPANLPSVPNEMIVGGGYLWILTQAGNLGRMSPGGAYVEYPLQFGTGQNGIPNAAALAYGSTDGNVWVSGFNGHVARITPTGTVTDFAALNGANEEVNIASGPDGAMWFYDIPFFGATTDNSSKLARIDIYGQVTTYPLGLGRDFFGSLLTGGDGNLWFMDTAKNAVEKFSIIDHTVTSYTLPANQTGGGNGVLGLDGNVWFTHGNALARVQPDGTITEFKIPSGNQPSDLVVAGDGNIWFTEYEAGKIGQLVVSSITSGGNATINESGAILSNDETIQVLPPGFLSGSAKTALDTKPCPVITFIVKITPPTAGTYVSTTNTPSTCADLNVGARIYQTADGAQVIASVANLGPNKADNVVVTMTVTTTPGVTPSPGKPSPDTATLTTAGFTLTLKPAGGSLEPGGSMAGSLRLATADNNAPIAVSATSVGTSDTPDPNPKNNVETDAYAGALQFGRVTLPPDLSNVVVTPVVRGK